MHLSVHISIISDTMAWKKTWNSSFLSVLFLLFSFLCLYSFPLVFSSFFFFWHISQDPLIFVCFYMLAVVFSIPLRIFLSVDCPSIKFLYLPIPFIPLILNIVLVMHSSMKYAIDPPCSMSHKFMSTVFRITFICLIICYLWLFLFIDVKRWWSSSSTECQHEAHLLSWKLSLLCILYPVGSFFMQNLCIHCIPFIGM